MSLENLLVFVPTNLFRIYVNLQFLDIFLEKRKAVWHQIYSMTFCFLITSLGYILFHKPEINICTNIIGLLVMSLIFQGNTKKKVLSVCIIYAFNMLCDVVIMNAFLGHRIVDAINELYGTATVLLIAVCEILAEKLIYKKKNPDYISPNWTLLLIIPLSSIVMIHFTISGNMVDRNCIILIGMGLLIINIISFYLYSAMEKTYITNLENELLLQTSEIYKHQLDIIMNSQDQIHSLQHDMKYHIRELLSMANAQNMPEMIQYLEEMQKAAQNSNQYVDSGNKELDGNLNYLLKEAHQKLKEVSVKITVPEGDYIASFDINVLLSNLLDNAITASENSVRKYLYLEILMEKSLMYITVKNSFNRQINEEKGNFFSTKPDKNRHGYGLKNVKRIVKKYNGTFDIHYKDDEFCVQIMIYLSNMFF